MWVLLLIFAVIILLMMFVSAQLALGMIAMLFGFFPNPELAVGHVDRCRGEIKFN